ncbi:recombination-associated protein RdgC [Rodentibacter pneumotropicus]|uniref:recombination-associated protein RdgC n=1 Tax=Rodentibacter TaxID=1960084 RepID=UPI000750F91C|nr:MULTISPECIES: recombination-associated protein RdgC [Rodentibacter]AOF53663.1 DNA recombination-dependent growth factor C [Pasteurellaceae bacterium NI1060]MCQ9124329.1 recombination-associated protein RdgC [Rodentibacter heylii]MCX2960348.1 recombination-associated protein RdgC [Rodentibacter heylii]OOF68522.1 recombination-associated protein RdgC [Rodentibacter pneumotropicus]OOF72356.1 recombination-associated protein RdgC [Rodentibacter heylii]
MFWFKNAIIYRLTKALDFSNLEHALQECKFVECSANEASKFGWTNPLATSEQLFFNGNGYILLVAQKEEKILPTSVIQKETDSRISALEEKEQRKLKKTEKQIIKDDVVATLLPRAFSKYQHMALLIDVARQLIYVDTASAKRAEDVLALLRKSLGSLPAVPVSFVCNPAETMTSWIGGRMPDWLMLQEECKLRSIYADGQVIFKHQDLESEEVYGLLRAKNVVTKLALDWEDHISFALSETGSLSKIKFADVIREKNDDILKEDVAQRFDADFFLMTSELGQLFDNLTTEFCGLKQSDEE